VPQLLKGVKIMSRKEKRKTSRKATPTLQALYLRRKKLQAIKENVFEIVQIIGGFVLCYAFMWLICAVAFVM
jgi:hypothetical protein